MNIYLHVEISSRELDSKLLLATLAASRGHDIIVSDLIGILKGIDNNLLAPGIFHTKSLTPGEDKIERHKKLIDKGYMITSIDEEGNLNEHGYQLFARQRYSNKTIEQASAIFGWGSEDIDTLKEIYSNHSKKIFKTGSPRADLWKSSFSNYWKAPSNLPKKPFLLIASNLGYANNIRSFKEYIKFEKKIGRFERDPNLLRKRFGETAEDFNKFFYFIEAIKYLSKNANDYDIVLRPHPSEDIETWKIFLSDIKNVHIIREGPINAWLNKSFAVMHNSCTTALEATVSKKPLITYIPFEQNYASNLANELGYVVKTLEELSNKVKLIFDTTKLNNQEKVKGSLPEILSKKIFIDEDELAAKKIIRIWENIAADKYTKISDIKKFKWLIKFDNYKQIIKSMIKILIRHNSNSNNENYKFYPLEQNDMQERIERIQNILGIKEKISCKLLSNRTLHVKRL
tara:strand:- start:1601 stop:2974 length:1374 start_codon:yes stop_codon:yes gene_type:complete